VRIRIADSGPGLPAGLEERIFDPFVSTKETGLGLGLSICRRIVDAHGGSITAANSPTGGAVFEVQLPCLAGAVASQDGVLMSHGAE
jgi:signal transduction histidine kinase